MSEQATPSTTLSTPEFKQKLGSLFSYLVSHLGIKQAPKVKLINSRTNAENPFGFTGHYDHANQLITLYITDRHDTDVLRSFAHEVIHHWQFERGTLHPEEHDNSTGAAAVSGKNHTHYAQESPWLRRREMEAYLFGNILFRDWQDEQRMGPPQTPPTLPQPLDENIMAQGEKLKRAVDKFAQALASSGVLGSYHRDRTSGDMQAQDFTQDLSHDILSAIEQWVQTVNNRSNWENSPDMIKETTCKGCGQECDYGNINEVSMGLIRCPNCNRKMDQEGNVYGG